MSKKASRESIPTASRGASLHSSQVSQGRSSCISSMTLQKKRNSWCELLLLRKAPYFSLYFMFEFTCHETELILLPCFRAFKGRMRSPQVIPSSPMPLGCQISDPEAAKEMQLDVKLNMQSSNYKRKGATHLTQVGGPGVLIA